RPRPRRPNIRQWLARRPQSRHRRPMARRALQPTSARTRRPKPARQVLRTPKPTGPQTPDRRPRRSRLASQGRTDKARGVLTYLFFHDAVRRPSRRTVYGIGSLSKGGKPYRTAVHGCLYAAVRFSETPIKRALRRCTVLYAFRNTVQVIHRRVRFCKTV